MFTKIKKKLTSLFRYPLAGIKGNLFFLLYNPFFRLTRLFSKKQIPSNEPFSKILLCCRASFGDVLIACSLIPAIKERYPEALIGFLCNPETKDIFLAQRGIDFIHTAGGEELRKVEYDLSIELHPFFPNSIPLVWKAKIPQRIGFASGGYDLLLTDPVPFPQKSDYLPYLYGELVKKVGIVEFTPSLQVEVVPYLYNKEYLVLHLGTSDPRKEWDLSKWKELSIRLNQEGFFLFFTGKGEREKKLVQEAFGESLGKNVCDQLTWSEFASLILGAKAVISVDSLAVHLAALQKVPVVALYFYSHGVELWTPKEGPVSLLIGKKAIRRNEEIVHPKAIYLDEINVLDILHSLKSLI